MGMERGAGGWVKAAHRPDMERRATSGVRMKRFGSGSLVAAVDGRGWCRWYVLITSSSPRLTDPDSDPDPDPRSSLGEFLRQHESEEGNVCYRKGLHVRTKNVPPDSADMIKESRKICAPHKRPKNEVSPPWSITSIRMDVSSANPHQHKLERRF
ncbi:hypothetical protein OPV22_011743 [Ensete ventricosum]|uniref:Uncharacterized protein n=1 Tax=Ensete ventricosum TaxID=4639 RepID=A0AAV8RNP2_ENSVE|nr:hypothetical protein OPV22_011743 [Ensete ventricosum]